MVSSAKCILACSAIACVIQTQVLAGEVDDAVQLLQYGFACPTKPEVSRGGPGGASGQQLVWKFTGNSKIFVVTLDSIGFARNVGRQTGHVEYSVSYATLEKVLTNVAPVDRDRSVTIVCRDDNECIRSRGVDAGQSFSENLSAEHFNLCDHETAEAVKSAIQKLIEFNH